MDKLAPILINNAEEWEAEGILNYGVQNNRQEFIVHWKGYKRADYCLKPSENLKHSVELIQEYWNTNHPTEQTRKINSHYVKAVSQPIPGSTTPCEGSAALDALWKAYDDEIYDSSSSEVDYFSIYKESLL